MNISYKGKSAIEITLNESEYACITIHNEKSNCQFYLNHKELIKLGDMIKFMEERGELDANEEQSAE